eukprot:gene9822-10830_t
MKFWKPGAEAPGSGAKEELSEGNEGAGTVIKYNPNVSLSMQQQKQKLPVFTYRNHILYLLEQYQTLVIVGETGSGKSTQIPQYLHESGWTDNGMVVAVTQPRRVAATTVAERVAEEMGTFVGKEVGYAIRFDNCIDPELTRIKFMTDGYLLREMMADPLLSKYSVIMLDEAHERTLYTDIIAGLLKKILKKRTDLKLIVSSATLDAEEFHRFFNLNQTDDQSPVPNYLKATFETVMSIHREEPNGDVLAFLTGQDEVETVVSMLRNEADNLRKKDIKLSVVPLYGGLPFAEQHLHSQAQFS